MSTAEAKRIKQLEQANRELKWTNGSESAAMSLRLPFRARGEHGREHASAAGKEVGLDEEFQHLFGAVAAEDRDGGRTS